MKRCAYKDSDFESGHYSVDTQYMSFKEIVCYHRIYILILLSFLYFTDLDLID